MIKAVHRPTIVVVGSGMAGAKVVEEILSIDPDRFQIRMFGAEPHGTYNRILLSTLLGGFEDPDSLWLNTREWYESNGVYLHAGVKVETIDPHSRIVEGRGGKVTEPYDILVLATGSRPFVPPISGTDKDGAFVFRTIEDCGKITTYGEKCNHAVVLGGGLLGLEAARGLLSHDLDVTVVEMAGHLMPQQLDSTGGEVLRRKMKDLGVETLVGTQVTELLGNGHVTGVRLSDGSILDTDMVVISCGIRPNVDEAKAAGIHVERGVVVDDQMRSSEDDIYALGECAQHRGRVYGLVDPIYEQARVLAQVITETNPHAKYHGTQPATRLKVMGVDLTSLGNVTDEMSGETVTHLDLNEGVYKKFVLRENRLVGAILIGIDDPMGRFTRMVRDGSPIEDSAAALLEHGNARDALLDHGDNSVLRDLPMTTQICNCNEVCKGTIVDAIEQGHCSVSAIGDNTKAGTGCGTCQPILAQLVDTYSQTNGKPAAPKLHKAELVKARKNGLDILEEIAPLLSEDRWKDLTADQKDLIKWHGLFFRKPTPGQFMLRLRMNAGQSNSQQFRVVADLSDEFGKGFCDLTTRQQIQMRAFTLADVSEIWRRLAEVGLQSKQTGADNVRGVCGCPAAGRTPHELFDASNVVREFTDLIVENREFTNLPRKFNVTITGCLENCCHTETQDVALVPASNSTQLGFNVLVGGKQGSGGYTPAVPLNVFVSPDEAAEVCGEITRIFRDNGARTRRNRARFAFLIQDKGIHWVRAELEKRLGRSLPKAGTDARKKHHVDHIGIHPQFLAEETGERLHYVGMIVPVGRLTTKVMRQVADLADKYGNGEIRLAVGQNLLVPNIPEHRLEELKQEPLFEDIPYDPSPIMRGLVSCTGNDYCAMALIDTKGYAIEVAKELEKRTEGRKLKPLTIHWSGCPAGCGLHQVATIGLQGCRSRVDGEILDAAHVCINGKAGPDPVIATDVLKDVPISRLADSLEPFVTHAPRLQR